MAGAEQIRLQQFEAVAVSAPPALLCQQLLFTGIGQDQGAPQEQGADLQQLLRQNPALLLRVLDARFRLHPDQAHSSLTSRLAQPDLAWLHSQLTDMALQLVLCGAQGNHLFHQLYWQDSIRTATLALALARHCGRAELEQVELCALLLDCGKLVLEQQHGSAWVGLFLEIDQQLRLLQAERQSLGLDHVEAGVQLLQGWQLEQDCVDALRYQAEPLQAVLDATTLVRISWLARVLAGLRPELDEVQAQAAQQLFNIDAAALQSIKDSAQADYDARVRLWDPAAQFCQSRHAADPSRQHFNRDLREELQRLQWQLLSERALLNLDSTDVRQAGALAEVLATALQQAGIEPRFLVLATRPGEQYLQHVVDHKLGPVPAALGLQLQRGRSALADLVLSGQLARLDTAQQGLSVIDRQVLQVLGGSLLCEPVATPLGQVVLLLAGNQHYVQRRLLRAFVQRKLAAFQQATGSSSASGMDTELLLYRQRVREAVHEANNPLAIIKNYLQILHMKLGEAGAAKEIRIISGEIDRVAGILASLRQLDAAPAPAREVDLNALLRSLHPVLEQGIGLQPGLALQLDLAPDPVKVQVAPDALKQVLMNLVKNAAEAMAGAGSISVATRRNLYQNGALHVQLSVRDEGSGMSAEQLADPFAAGRSTKGGSHRGTGLAIVKRLVDEMQGQLSCQSDSKGTLISIVLPQIP